jgi:hypothetical protein
MAIGRFLNCRERVTEFCEIYQPTDSAKKLADDDILKEKHWLQLEYLHTHLEPFYVATLLVEGPKTSLADAFQALDWLVDSLDTSKNAFLNLAAKSRRRVEHEAWQYLSDCASQAWEKANKYYLLTDQEYPATYAAIIFNPTLKIAWFDERWAMHPVKKDYI